MVICSSFFLKKLRAKSYLSLNIVLYTTVCCSIYFGGAASTLAQGIYDSKERLTAETSGELNADRLTQFLLDKKLVTMPLAENTPDKVRQIRDKAGNMASEMILSAMHFLGVKYRRGGNSEETGFDCSGFTRHVFEKSLGILLPRRAQEQAQAPGLLAISRDQLKPGDLVFFNTLRQTFSHVGIYIGNDKFIHSPRAGSEIRIEDMNMSYWVQRFNGARRPLPNTSTFNPDWAIENVSGTELRANNK